MYVYLYLISFQQDRHKCSCEQETINKDGYTENFHKDCHLKQNQIFLHHED
jgi:hypothetical protein